MKKLAPKKEYIIIIVVIVLFIFVSLLSLSSIHQLRGNARVVNYVGIVRGATQKLAKEELYDSQDDRLIARLDTIINELITGEGPNGLTVLQDETYLRNMNQVKNHWADLKDEIMAVRNGADKATLFSSSQDYFDLVDRTVSSAEAFSETQVQNSTNSLIVINLLFVSIILVGVISIVRSISIRKRAELLGKIAYIDPLTQMPNRASCEREIDKYQDEKYYKDLAVFMFDMNNLKLVNDMMGHQGGDRIIADFARIIKNTGEQFGFVGRYGGDEFIAILPEGTPQKAENYITQINEKVVAYNLLHINNIEKISFATDYVIGNLKGNTFEELINEADRKMYVRKRQMKENKDLY